jgi:hypothetical membrane protein
MPMIWDFQIAKIFGIAGCLVILSGVFITTLSYRGRKGERFSLLNHFISELGEAGVAKLASFFNTGLILGGLLLMPFLIYLGLRLNSIPGWLGCLAGIWTATSSMAVGFFPMNRLEPHTKAAMAYFRGGLATVLFFGLAILLQPADRTLLPRAANWISLISIAAYASFLVLLNKNWSEDFLNPLDTKSHSGRPQFWLLPFMEWVVFFSSMLWFLVMAMLL